MRVKLLAVLGVLLGFGTFLHYGGLDALRDFSRMYWGTPHERYAARLERGRGAETAGVHRWLSSADSSLRNPREISLPRQDELRFTAHAPEAIAFVVPLRRGQRFMAAAAVNESQNAALFLDLFVQDGASVRHVGNAARDETFLALEIGGDGDYVLRVQPELGRDVTIRLGQRAEPTHLCSCRGSRSPALRGVFSASRRCRVEKPDFTGEWTLNLEASALSPVVAPAVQAGFVRIEHREPSVSVHLSITMDGKPFEARFERPSEWDGETLVFADRIQAPNGDLTIVFRYELQEGGRRLRAAEQLRGPDREQDNVWVFDRAS